LRSVVQISVVRFENVTKRYAGGPDILRGVSFSLEPGSFTFLTGPSGAGKSTLMKLMYLAEQPTQGLISLFGQELPRLKRWQLPAMRRRVGVVFQNFRLFHHLTAFENVELPLRLEGQNGPSNRRDVEELLNWVGLGDKMDEKPLALSGGEQQRVAIARAVVAKPDLILADEPTGNVDPNIGDRLIRLFTELNRFGTTIMIATHDRAPIEATHARELHLENGRLIDLGGGS
jgi:cell division transport system ATP-binding protein